MFINRDKVFAVAVDFQEKLMPSIGDSESMIKTSVRLFNGLKLLGVDIVVTQQYTRGLGSTIPEILDATGTSEYVEKVKFGAYEDMAKAIPLSSYKPYVIITGVEAHVCVLQTALGLKEAGYKPIIVTDCIGSRNKTDLEIAIERAKQEGMILATCESILFELLHEAGTDEFRAISRLVK